MSNLWIEYVNSWLIDAATNNVHNNLKKKKNISDVAKNRPNNLVRLSLKKLWTPTIFILRSGSQSTGLNQVYFFIINCGKSLDYYWDVYVCVGGVKSGVQRVCV